jgi:predicted nucleic acid-binding protein
MTPFVVDCSITMAWCFEDECDPYADAALGALEETEVLVPSVWTLEMANVIVVAERQRRLTKADSTRFVELLGGLRIVVEEAAREHVLTRVLGCARDFGLSAYDAAYLELAMRHGVALATTDRALRSACRKSGTRLFAA